MDPPPQPNNPTVTSDPSNTSEDAPDKNNANKELTSDLSSASDSTTNNVTPDSEVGGASECADRPKQKGMLVNIASTFSIGSVQVEYKRLGNPCVYMCMFKHESQFEYGQSLFLSPL